MAHPRACGENVSWCCAARGPPGSSPRVRGKRYYLHWPSPLLGLIPARAGKTPPRAPGPSPGGAHPRACGENAAQLDQRRGCGGSSPRVRGKRVVGEVAQEVVGLIPARAGKTFHFRSVYSPEGAHPRACGENPAVAVDGALTVGSSPRVRGKRAPHARRVGPRRLIPARAGKTTGGGTGAARRRAHPRACGEN